MSDRKKSTARKYDGDSERRVAPRENVAPIEITGFTSLDHRTLITRLGHIVNASSTGFLLHIARKDLVPQEFRDSLSLAALEGDQIILKIEPMDLEIGGRIARTHRLNKEVFAISIDFSSDAPEYWREALIDMLPRASDYEKE